MIRVNLDVMLAKRRLSSGELAERLGIKPADILEYVPDTTESEAV